MDVLEAILTRRSVRRYADVDVSDEVVETLLKAGMFAPSAHNEQPWHFIVLRERAMLEKITEIHPYAQMLKDAAVGICVCADLTLEKDPGIGYWIQDCSAATENILLAARGMGYGSCWMGVHPREERKKAIGALLGLPDHVVPFGLIAIGVGLEDVKPANRFKENRIHYNGW